MQEKRWADFLEKPEAKFSLSIKTKLRGIIIQMKSELRWTGRNCEKIRRVLRQVVPYTNSAEQVKACLLNLDDVNAELDPLFFLKPNAPATLSN